MNDRRTAASLRISALLLFCDPEASQKDVKNEDRSHDVYENKGWGVKLPRFRADFLPEKCRNIRIPRHLDLEMEEGARLFCP